MKRLVVLDTSCLVQSLPAKSPYHKIWEDFLQGKFMLCVSNEILNEYEEIIERYSSASVARNVISAIVHSPYTLYKEASFKFNLIEADPDDNKFADCAIVANAEYIVSEDAHFRILATFPFPKIRVVGLDEFLTDLLVDI
ncbi:putative toxin-antitoxin system toxin component, PIN family [Phocaeicola vulgatus]|uniref:putative toxin-antitoxin system toxin component, PIN family n=1 Tax=Phocaeicola vulgatus TaxID=821 RepID=UPI001C37F3CB|nr:putative toxin-antitoxin system toxin component, PIN family [Phocaeicola vulgatus]MBV4185349.1 putative toxin-antitoxin system toxin component, PIN family [Phocaeicola vulgatus]